MTVSHTVSDLLFEWDPTLPLDVSTSIELPQLELIRYDKADCTQIYSTGKALANLCIKNYIKEQLMSRISTVRNLLE